MKAVFSLILLAGVTSTMVRANDLTDVSEFKVGNLPVILRSTPSYGDIVVVAMSTYGASTLEATPGALDMLTRGMWKGTPSYSKEDIDRIITETGASPSIEAQPDAVTVTIKLLKKFIPQVFPVISEMLTNPLLRKEEIELIRSQLLADLKQEQEHPDAILGLLSHRSFYRDHPYLKRPHGYLETIPNVQREELVDLLPKVFNSNNLIVSMVGNISKEEAAELIQKYFGGFPEGTRIPPVPTTVTNKIGEIDFQTLKAPTTYFNARFKAPSLPDPDYPAMTIASEILGNKLFEEVRTKRGLTYSVAAYLSQGVSTSGSLYVSSTQLPEAVKVMFDEVRKMQTDLLPATDLANQVKKFISSWYLGRETGTVQARIFLNYETLGMGWKASNSFIERVQKVTPEDVRRVMQKYFTDYTVTLVGPERLKIESLIPGMPEPVVAAEPAKTEAAPVKAAEKKADAPKKTKKVH